MSVVSTAPRPKIFYLPFDGHKIRACLQNDVMWVCGLDATKAFKYGDPSSPLRDIDKADQQELLVQNDRNQLRPMKFIHEAAFYELAFRSRLPAARQFTRKVFGEILPQIRRTGIYISSTVSAIVQNEARPWELMYDKDFRDLIKRTGMSQPEFYKFMYEKLHPAGTYDTLKSQVESRWFPTSYRFFNVDKATGKRVMLHQFYKDMGIEYNKYKQGQLSMIIQYMLMENGNRINFLEICDSVFGQKAIVA